MSKILIVDDSSYMRMNLKKILYRNGFEDFYEAKTGLEAINLVEKYNFDIILMDIDMPQMDGITALKSIIARHQYMKIIMVSAEGDENTMKLAILSGASDFILKPFKESKVIKVVKSILKE